ncbi:hypothetical protein GFB49_01745 [Epibacterium sp. SM1979]|uniref:HupE / UreJ protein n=1 Tax=Tritonibacter litoralis TaxID=2662264 RepID=A0A843YE83_9RHOB|nr:hypothetical protein [Tritonibacter litoralis]MQQ07167.1 hypothetical protein [Tritonibacter litoralis]
MIAGAMVCWLLCGVTAFAQTEKPTQVRFRADETRLFLDIVFNDHDTASWADTAGATQVFAQITDGIVSFGGTFAQTDIRGIRQTDSATHIALEVEIPPDALTVQFYWPQMLGPVVLQQLDVSEPFSGIFLRGRHSEPILIRGGSARSVEEIAFQNLQLGFMKAWPRDVGMILLALVIFLKRGSIGPMAAQLACLGLGFSLAAVALPYVHWSPDQRLVDWALPVLTAVLALDNILFRNLQIWRGVLLFGFGALQISVFATSIENAGLPITHLLPASAGFGAGNFIALLTWVCVAYAVIGLWLGRSSKYRGRVIMPTSLTVIGFLMYQIFL